MVHLYQMLFARLLLLWQNSARQMSALQSLPTIKNQTVFNLDRWDELPKDPEIERWPGRVETDRHGHIIMSYYSDYSHGGKQMDVGSLLRLHLPSGKTTVETPISTSEGIKVADVAWVSKARLAKIGGRAALKAAPEICVEVLSPKNTRNEIEEKRRLYFEAGAQEVWILERNGTLHFFLHTAPDKSASKSKLCPKAPSRIDD